MKFGIFYIIVVRDWMFGVLSSLCNCKVTVLCIDLEIIIGSLIWWFWYLFINLYKLVALRHTTRQPGFKQNTIRPALCHQQRIIPVNFTEPIHTLVSLIEVTLVGTQGRWTIGTSESPSTRDFYRRRSRDMTDQIIQS